MTEKPKALPCPFCGGEGHLLCGSGDRYYYECEEQCQSVDRKTEAEALADWNKRAPDPEALAMREVVEEAKSVVQRAGRRPDGTAWANLNINDLAAKVEALRAQEKSGG